MKKSFSIRENIQFGFKRVCKNLKFIIPFYIVFSGIVLLFSFLEDYHVEGVLGEILFDIIIFLQLVLSFSIALATYKVGLHLAENKKIKVKDIQDISLFFKFALAVFIYQLIVLIGFIFFLFPGIIAMLKFQFVPYLILEEKGIGIKEAFHKSNLIASGAQWKLLLLNIAINFLNFLGILCFVIGLFFAIPTGVIANAKIYKELKAQTKLD